MSARKNKGSTLIEGMVALFIAALTIIGAATAFSGGVKGKGTIDEVMEGAYKLETMKKILICNYSYEELKEVLKDKTFYMSMDILNSIQLEDLDLVAFLEEEKGQVPLVEVQGEEGEGGTMVIKIVYYFQGGNKINSVFYKGNYEEFKD